MALGVVQNACSLASLVLSALFMVITLLKQIICCFNSDTMQRLDRFKGKHNILFTSYLLVNVFSLYFSIIIV